MGSIYDVVTRMGMHQNKIILQDDAIDDPDYVPGIFNSVDELMGSDLFNRVADYEVTELYSDHAGTMWICYECGIA